MFDERLEPFYSVAQRIAAVHAAKTAMLCGLLIDARADLEQEVLLELWRKRCAFDPRRGCWKTFLEVVATNRMISTVRKMCAQRSGFFKEQPLERDSSVVAPDRRDELRVDVMQVLAGVSAFDRTIARSLAQRSPSETSRELGISRAKVYRAIGRLRMAFRAAGFEGGRGMRQQGGRL